MNVNQQLGSVVDEPQNCSTREFRLRPKFEVDRQQESEYVSSIHRSLYTNRPVIEHKLGYIDGLLRGTLYKGRQCVRPKYKLDSTHVTFENH